MRNRVLLLSPRVQNLLILVCALALALLLAGCGGGSSNNAGGGGGGGGLDPTRATVTGIVRDFGGAGVASARITIAGAPNAVLTDANGRFSVTNVPVNALTMTITRPANTGYYDVVEYRAQRYDTTRCPLPLPALAAGQTTALPGDITIFGGRDPNANTPPPPPLPGCPP
jgi:hypothetical protein